MATVYGFSDNPEEDELLYLEFIRRQLEEAEDSDDDYDDDDDLDEDDLDFDDEEAFLDEDE
ncbi:MAG: hypothetical protein LBR73_01790 [Oscillospiraceae bacterium]|nr:hypothetical protein [Oscillospiraceae bacterium]